MPNLIIVPLSWMTIFQLGVAGGIIGITKTHMDIDNVCYYTIDITSKTFCNYGYIIGGVGLGIGCLLFLFSVLAVREKIEKTSRFLMGLLWSIGAAWFAVAGTMYTLEYTKMPPSLAENEWRIAVFSLMWSSCGLYILMNGISQLQKRFLTSNATRPIIV